MLYSDIVALNVRVARAALKPKLSQAGLAERMRALGFSWYPQTVGSTEAARRMPKLDEIIALTAALETDVTALVYPPGRHPWQPVELRNGFEIVLPPARAAYQPGSYSIWTGNRLTQPPQPPGPESYHPEPG